MVKGVSKQVILVQAPGDELFDQAIFILKDKAVANGVSDEELLKQAKFAIQSGGKTSTSWHWGPVWACGGALVTALAWILSIL